MEWARGFPKSGKREWLTKMIINIVLFVVSIFYFVRFLIHPLIK